MSLSAAAGRNNDNSHPPELHAKWLGVRVVVDAPRKKVTTTPVRLSKDLLTHEQALKVLADALEALRKRGQDKLELQRLRIFVDAVHTYDSFWKSLRGGRRLNRAFWRWIRKSLSFKKQKRRMHASVLKAVAELEKLGFTSYLLAVPEYNKRMLKERLAQVKEILSSFHYPYNRRIAGQHGHFTKEDYRRWLKEAKRNDLARALRRLAQLNQSKIYLFWKRSQA